MIQEITQTIFTKFKQSIPEKTQIFLLGFYIWTWVLFQFSLLVNYLLGLIIKWMPNKFIPNIKSRTPVQIIEATDGNGNIITNKLKLFMNLKWDKNLCDGTGGIDLDSFLQNLGTSVMWIAYLMEYDTNPTFKEFMDLLQKNGDNFKFDDFKDFVSVIVIDIGKKIVHKFKDDIDIQEDILFGEVNFHHNS